MSSLPPAITKSLRSSQHGGPRPTEDYGAVHTGGGARRAQNMGGVTSEWRQKRDSQHQRYRMVSGSNYTFSVEENG